MPRHLCASVSWRCSASWLAERQKRVDGCRSGAEAGHERGVPRSVEGAHHDHPEAPRLKLLGLPCRAMPLELLATKAAAVESSCGKSPRGVKMTRRLASSWSKCSRTSISCTTSNDAGMTRFSMSSAGRIDRDRVQDTAVLEIRAVGIEADSHRAGDVRQRLHLADADIQHAVAGGRQCSNQRSSRRTRRDATAAVAGSSECLASSSTAERSLHRGMHESRRDEPAQRGADQHRKDTIGLARCGSAGLG